MNITRRVTPARRGDFPTRIGSHPAQLLVLPTVCCLAIFASGASRVAAATGPTAASLSRQAIPENTGWQSYLLDPATAEVYPRAVSVTGLLGTVTNAQALASRNGTPTCINAVGPDEPYIDLDFGKNVGGLVSLQITQTDGTAVRLAYSEMLRYQSDTGDMLPESAVGAQGRGSTISASAPGVYTDSGGMTGAERWIRVSLAGAGTVCISNLKVTVTHYRPGPDAYDGHFLSNDDLVNRIWYGSAYTLHMATFPFTQGGPLYVTDGAKRDRAIWFGDLTAELPVGFYSTAAAARGFMRDTLTLIRCNQGSDGYISSGIFGSPSPCLDNTPAPALPACSNTAVDVLPLGLYDAMDVIDARQYELYSGDEALVRRLIPNLRAALEWMNCHLSNGLYTAGAGELNWHVFDVAYGADTNTNAWYYWALRTMADFERRIGDGSAAAAKWDARADALRAAMLAQLWDPAAGAFRLNTADPNDNHPQDGNVMAVLAGVVTGSQAQQALDYVHEHLWSIFGTLDGELTDDPWMSQIVSPFIGTYELLTRFANSDGADAITLLRREWGHMIQTDPASTTWEKIGTDGYMPTQINNGVGYGIFPPQTLIGPGEQSAAHGWSTGALRALSQKVLGLEPTGPGWSTWQVAPQPVDLRWAQGQVGTPAGPLVSRWERGSDDAWFRATIAAPTGTSGAVAIPLLGQPRAIARDGTAIWDGHQALHGSGATTDGNSVYVPAGAGTHTYAWAGAGQ
jgi:hypothetical protein